MPVVDGTYLVTSTAKLTSCLAFNGSLETTEIVRWKRVRKWVPASGSFRYCDSYVTAIGCFHRVDP